jgi:hypothetical protein
MKRVRTILIGLALAPLVAWSLLVIAYRLPAGSAETIEGEVLFKYLDLEGGLRGLAVENVFGHKRLRLTDGRVFYIDAEDRARVWAENPHDLHARGRTKQVVLEVRPLAIGGYGVAKVREVRVLAKQAEIRK